jgi:hypothetical protein
VSTNSLPVTGSIPARTRTWKVLPRWRLYHRGTPGWSSLGTLYPAVDRSRPTGGSTRVQVWAPCAVPPEVGTAAVGPGPEMGCVPAPPTAHIARIATAPDRGTEPRLLADPSRVKTRMTVPRSARASRARGRTSRVAIAVCPLSSVRQGFQCEVA